VARSDCVTACAQGDQYDAALLPAFHMDVPHVSTKIKVPGKKTWVDEAKEIVKDAAQQSE
jgi:hypothetical protein